MKGDIAFAGFMLTAEEWQALDSETRHQLVAVATRRFPTGTEPPYEGSRNGIPIEKTFISGGTIIEEKPALAEGSGPLECDDYIDLTDD